MTTRSDAVIVLIDDDVLFIRTLPKHLHQQGYLNVLAFQKPDEGLRFLLDLANAPDVVLLDLRMPGIGGLDILEILKERRSGLIPRTIILSASNDPETANLVAWYNVAGFLWKPLRIGQGALFEAVEAVLRGEKIPRSC